MLSIIMLSDVVFMLRVITLSFIVLNVVILSVVDTFLTQWKSTLQKM
jgi:hypothetical protein